jgi:hypothetical protein
MEQPIFTPDELELVADTRFFLTKAQIMMKIRRSLEILRTDLTQELFGMDLIAPNGFSLAAYQFVKGEHLEDFPYQYLDFPKHFDGDVKFTYRSLFWWGHHFVFALIMEGGELARYKKNLINRYGKLADKGLSFCLGGSPWEWKRGEGYTIELTWERKSDVTALLSNRSFLKLARFVPYSDPRIPAGQIAEIGRSTLRDLLPVVTA